MKTLQGHSSEETAYLVDDYPYGFRLRTQIRYWLEQNKKGTRFVSQTLNPKTDKWNKPKKTTYSDVMVMVLNEDDHVKYMTLSYNDKEEYINKFVEKYNEVLTEEDRKVIKLLIAYDRGMKHIKWKVVPSSEGEHQTSEEQNDIINKAVGYEYNKMQGDD